MFNNNGNSPPPNYYPNDNVFYNETTNQTNNFNIEKLLPILSGNINPLELLKSYSINPQLSQILGLLTSLQRPAKNKKKATTQSSSCQYVLVKDYYAKKELED